MRPPAAEAALFAWFGWRRNREARRPDLASSSCSKRGVKIWQKGWRRGGGDEERIKVLYYTLVLAYEKASTTCKNSLFYIMGKSGSQGQSVTACKQTLGEKELLCHAQSAVFAYIAHMWIVPSKGDHRFSFSFRYSHNPTTHTDISRLLLPLLPTLKYSCVATGK